MGGGGIHSTPSHVLLPVCACLINNIDTFYFTRLNVECLKAFVCELCHIACC